jgi:hypothetical protein
MRIVHREEASDLEGRFFDGVAVEARSVGSK